MSFLSKIEKAVDVASSLKSIAGKLDSSGLLNGINLNNIDVGNLNNMGSIIQSNISGMTDGFTKEIMDSVNMDEIEKIGADIKPSDLGIDMNEFTNFDIPGVDTSSLGIDLSSLNGLEFK